MATAFQDPTLLVTDGTNLNVYSAVATAPGSGTTLSVSIIASTSTRSMVAFATPSSGIGINGRYDSDATHYGIVADVTAMGSTAVLNNGIGAAQYPIQQRVNNLSLSVSNTVESSSTPWTWSSTTGTGLKTGSMTGTLSWNSGVGSYNTTNRLVMAFTFGNTSSMTATTASVRVGLSSDTLTMPYALGLAVGTPPSITELEASGTTIVGIKWSSGYGGNPTGDLICQRSTDNVNWTNAFTLTSWSGAASQAVDSGLSPNTLYYYRFAVTNSQGTAYSATQTITTRADTTPPTVKSLAEVTNKTSTTSTSSGALYEQCNVGDIILLFMGETTAAANPTISTTFTGTISWTVQVATNGMYYWSGEVTAAGILQNVTLNHAATTGKVMGVWRIIGGDPASLTKCGWTTSTQPNWSGNGATIARFSAPSGYQGNGSGGVVVQLYYTNSPSGTALNDANPTPGTWSEDWTDSTSWGTTGGSSSTNAAAGMSVFSTTNTPSGTITPTGANTALFYYPFLYFGAASKVPTGYANLNAPGALSSSPIATEFAAAPLSAPGSLSSTPIGTVTGGAALNARGNLSSAGTLTTTGGVALNAPGSLTGASAKRLLERGTVPGSRRARPGIMRVSAGFISYVKVYQGSVTLSAPGSLSSAATPTRMGAVALNAPGSLASAATRTTTAAVNLNAAGAITQDAERTTFGAVNLNAPGAISPINVGAQGSANLNAPGALSVAGTRTTTAAVALNAPASLAVQPTPTLMAAVSLLAPGSIAQAATRTTFGAVNLNAAGALSAKSDIQGNSVLNAPGVLSVTASQTLVAAVALLAPGLLATAGTRTTTTAASLLAPGSLVTDATRTTFGAVNLNAPGKLIPNAGQQGNATLNAPGVLVVGSLLTATAAVALVAPGSLVADATRTTTGSVALVAPGFLSTTATRIAVVAAALSGPGAITSDAGRTSFGTVNLNAAGLITVQPLLVISVAAALSAPGNLSANGQQQLVAAIALNAPGNISFQPGQQILFYEDILVPDAILTQTGLTGTLTAIDEGTANDDGLWLTSAVNTNTTLAVSFPTPAGDITGQTQTFRARVRKTTGTTAPTAKFELRSNGVVIATLQASTSITSTTGQILQGTWTPDGTDPATLEVVVTGTVGGGQTAQRAAVEIGAVDWVNDYTVTTPAYGVFVTAFVSAALNAPGSLTTSTGLTGDVDLHGPGVLTSDPTAVRLVSAVLNAPGVLTADVTAVRPAAVSLFGPGSLVADSARTSFGAAALNAPGNLYANAGAAGSVTLNAAGALTVGSTARTTFAAVVLNGPGVIAPNGTRTTTAGVTLAAAGNLQILVGDPDRTTFGAVNLNAPGLISISAGGISNVGASLNAPGNISINGTPTRMAAVALNAPALISAAGIASKPAASTLNAPGALTVGSTGRTTFGAVTLNARGNLAGQPVMTQRGTVNLNAAGKLTSNPTKLLVKVRSTVTPNKMVGAIVKVRRRGTDPWMVPFVKVRATGQTQSWTILQYGQ